ncbi:helix-turn-helix domain-containing protein [Actinoallomurus sp. CA-142502]|uniref:helix-turn-helix domain-containing protein n=1 Tax=Actinoallomurus sp. CA-142502 TaxID=3239885 RepID=UPI003D8B9791
MSAGADQITYEVRNAKPPGETLKENLDFLGISQADLARRTGLSIKHINQIALGAAVLTPETAILLERVLDVPADVWNALEASWRTQEQRRQDAAALQERLSWLDNFSLRELVARRIIPNRAKTVDNLRLLLEFLEVGTPEAAENVWGSYKVAFRRSTTKVPDDYATAVWLQLALRSAREIKCDPYSRGKLIALIPKIRALTLTEPAHWLAELPRICAQAGVAVVFEPAMPRTFLSGATRWLATDKVMLALSDRFKKIDQFWFAFFHEVGHIVLHGKRLTFLDENPAAQSGVSAEEEEANRFAADTLIPPAYAEQYRRLSEHPKPFRNIEAFAKFAQIAPGIVVGRLQYEGRLQWSEGHRMLTSVDFTSHKTSDE